MEKIGKYSKRYSDESPLLVMGWGVIETLRMAAGPIFCPTARQGCVRVAAGHEAMEPKGGGKRMSVDRE